MGASSAMFCLTRSQSVLLPVSITLAARGATERDDADIVSLFCVDECQDGVEHLDEGGFLDARFSCSWRVYPELGRIILDQRSVFEVESVLDEIGFALLLVPDEHGLIVDTYLGGGKLG
jgi:hypothetical protein